VRHVLFKAEYSPLSKVDRLVDTGSKNLGIVKDTCSQLSLVLLEYCWSFQDFGFDGIWLKVDVKIPFLNLFRISDHAIKLFDTSDPLWRLLEQALSDVCHHPLILSDLGWDSDKGAELWWKIDILPFLTDFKQRLVHRMNFNTVSSFKVVYHVGSGLLVSMVKDVIFWVHSPLDLMNLVGSMRAILGHDDGTFEFSVDEICIMSHTSVSN
jgi:hypothetical protein